MSEQKYSCAHCDKVFSDWIECKSHICLVQTEKDKIEKLQQELEAARVLLWQAKGALGYSVPGNIPCGDFICGLCDAKEKQLADAKAQTADYEAALEKCAKGCEISYSESQKCEAQDVANETLNKWSGK